MRIELKTYDLLTDDLIKVSLAISGHYVSNQNSIVFESSNIKEILLQALEILNLQHGKETEAAMRQKENLEEQGNESDRNELAGGNDKETWDALVNTLSPVTNDKKSSIILRTPKDLFQMILKIMSENDNFLKEIQERKNFTPPSFAIGDMYERDKTHKERKKTKIDGLYLILSYASFYLTRISDYYVDKKYHIINLYSFDNFIVDMGPDKNHSEGSLKNIIGRIGFSSEIAAMFHLYTKFYELIPYTQGQQLVFGFVVFSKNKRGSFEVKNVEDYKLGLSNEFFKSNLKKLTGSNSSKAFEYLINKAMFPKKADLKQSIWSTVNSFMMDLYNFLNSQGKMESFKIKYNRIIYTDLYYPYLIGKSPDKKNTRYYVLVNIKKIMKTLGE